ncbi:MAG: GC-type dockerin domain-anchored protein [Phycisphaerales bacterium JB039]
MWTSAAAAIGGAAVSCGAWAQLCEPRWSDEFAGAGVEGTVQGLRAGADRLYVGGWFTTVGGIDASRIAEYADGAWGPLGRGFIYGTGCHGAPPYVITMLEVDLPGLSGLIAGGSIADAGGIPTEAIARWDGSAWHTIGPDGLPLRGWADGCADVRDMVVFDDGRGPALYACGWFDTPGAGVARWNGMAWEPVGGDVALWAGALQIHDDGRGFALYLGGIVAVAGPARYGVVRWDGEAWTAVGVESLDFDVHDLIEFEISGRRTLVVAGGLRDLGQASWWDGESWLPLGGQFDGEIHALASFDDGSGPALYAGGAFSTYDGAPAPGLARWTGTEWEEAYGGVDGAVYALEPAAHEGVWSLVVGGYFADVGAGVASQSIARLVGCLPVCPPDCDASGALDFFDFLCFQDRFAAGDLRADCDGSGELDLFDFLCFQNEFAAGCG